MVTNLVLERFTGDPLECIFIPGLVPSTGEEELFFCSIDHRYDFVLLHRGKQYTNVLRSLAELKDKPRPTWECVLCKEQLTELLPRTVEQGGSVRDT